MLFSKRNGYTPAKALQLEAIDDELRNRLWNLFTIHFWNLSQTSRHKFITINNYGIILSVYWDELLKSTIDSRPNSMDDAVRILKKHFFSRNWYQVYDFIEFSLTLFRPIPDHNEVKKDFINGCNRVLTEENSGYRIIDDIVVPISLKVEISSLEETIALTDRFIGARKHISQALKHLSNKQNPDYRNSIKESISAVESICKVITGDKKATLGNALNRLETSIKIHKALKAGFSSLYGYTSDENGIRHAILEETDISFTDAKYMLVSCSAFVNYLVGKVADHNITIP